MPGEEQNMATEEVLEVKDTSNNDVKEPEENNVEEKTYTQEDINRIISQEKARLERKYRKNEESKLSKAKQLEDTLRTGLGLTKEDDVLSKVKEFYKEQGVNIPENQSISDKDAEVLGKADANEFINDYDDKEIEARANELAIKQKEGKTSAREDAEFFKLGEYLTEKLEEKDLEANGIDKSILKDQDFKKFASRFNRGTKMTEIYELYQKVNGSEAKKPPSTGSSKSTVPNNQEKEYYTPEEVDKLSNKQLDDPKIWRKVRESMFRW